MARVGIGMPMFALLRACGAWLRNNTAWAGSIPKVVAASVLAVFGVEVGGYKLRTLVGIVVFTRSGGALD